MDQTSQSTAPETVAAPVSPQAPVSPTAPVQEAAPPSPDLASLQAKIAAFEAQLQEKESAWGMERELLKSGVLDDEAQEVARHFYAKIPAPKEGSKPTISQWLANRDALPKRFKRTFPRPSPRFSRARHRLPRRAQLPRQPPHLCASPTATGEQGPRPRPGARSPPPRSRA